MGFSTKKKTIRDSQINFYYPQDKLPYGNTNRKKYIFDQLLTKRLIENAGKKLPPKDNIFELVKSMNFFHTVSFVPKKTKFCANLKASNIEIDVNKLVSKVNNLKEVITTSEKSTTLVYDWILSRIYDNYDIQKKLFVKDGFEWVVDSNYTKASPRYIKQTFSPGSLVPILPPLPKEILLDIDPDTYLEDTIKKALLTKLKSEYSVDEKDAIVSTNFHMFVESANYPNSIVNISSEFTWNGQADTSDSDYDEIKDIPESDRTTEQKIKHYNFVQIMIRLELPNYMLEAIEFMEDNSMILILYLNSDDKLQIILIEDKLSITNNDTSIKLTARYPLKGQGVIPRSKTREYRLYKLALEQAGYKYKEKKRYSKQEKDRGRDLVTSLAKEEKIAYGDIYQVINLFPALIKANRSNRHMVRYFREVLEFLDTLCGGFPKFNIAKPIYEYRNIDIDPDKGIPKNAVLVYEDKDSGFKQYAIKYIAKYEYSDKKIFSTPLPSFNRDRNDTSMRVVGVKRYVNKDSMAKECFIGQEPNVGGNYLYVNVKDYSKSTEEERAKGIYHGYIQYGLNLHVWFDNFTFSTRRSRFRRKFSSTSSSKNVPELVFTLETSSNPNWFNDGMQEFQSSYDDKFNKAYKYTGEDSKEYIRYLPQMPLKLWYKIPLSSKKEVAHFTIIVYTYIEFTIKVKRGFFKILMIVGSFLLGGVWAGFLAMANISGVLKGKIGAFISVAYALYSGYTNFLAGMKEGGLLGGLQTATSVVTTTNSVFEFGANLKMANKLSSMQSQMNSMNNQSKELHKSLLEKQLRGVNLNMYNVNVDFLSDMDYMYYIAYGNLLYNDFYSHLAYNEVYKKYQEYDKFK